MLMVVSMSVPLIGNAETILDDYSTSLISYWSLDETSGVREDLHGTNDLTDNNTVLYTTGKIENGSDHVASASEYLSITDASQSGLDISSDFTIAGWIYPDTVAQDGIVGKHTESSGEYGYSIGWLNAGTGHFAVAISSSCTSRTLSAVSAGSAFTTGSWQHFAIVYDASAGSVTAYKNAVAGSPTTGFPTSICDNTQPFVLGLDYTQTQYLDGGLDEVGVWSRVLSGTEITGLYNSGDGIPYSVSTTSTSTSTTTTTVDFDELKWTLELYLALFTFLIFTYIGYRFAKIFI